MASVMDIAAKLRKVLDPTEAQMNYENNPVFGNSNLKYLLIACRLESIVSCTNSIQESHFLPCPLKPYQPLLQQEFPAL
ncbi:hypothetical protein DRN50_04375 [Thermococci archaeon]|nr:MAG: hypothetical protein DRN50_04375 [Thermococci archaeon]